MFIPNVIIKLFYYSFKIFLSFQHAYLVDFLQNFGLFLGTVSGYKQMQILLKKYIKFIEQYVLAFFPL